MTPTHKNPTRENRTASAPYNFVRLPDAVLPGDLPPEQDRYDENLLTGRLECKLTTASPLYIRAAKTLEQFERDQTPSEPFHGSRLEDLRIPGSSLRGMLRTMVEIVSYSDIDPVSDSRLFYRTVEASSAGDGYRDRMLPDKVRAGFFRMTKNEAWIEPALAGRIKRSELVEKPYHLYERGRGPRRVPKESIQHRKVYVRLHDNAKSNPTKFFDIQDFSASLEEGLEPAVLVITGDMQNKKKEFVFVRIANAKKLPISDKQLARFQSNDQITQYQEYAFPKGQGRKQDGWLKDDDPVFYLPAVGGGVEAFGRAYMFRLPYKRSPAEMLDDSRIVREHIDMATAIFGGVDVKGVEQNAIAGRMFVTDGKFKGDPDQALFSNEPIIPQILSSPKPTSFQLYLTQDQPDNPRRLHTYDSNPRDETKLRGHKLYWHRGDVRRADFEADPDDVKKAPRQYNLEGIIPIKSGQIFAFRIHFENLRPRELGALLWVMDLANHSKYRFKLGMAKPYGLGSVKIQAIPILTVRKQRYKELFKDEETWKEGRMRKEEEQKTLSDARKSFIKSVLTNEVINPGKKYKRMEDLPRIQDLLMMLTWQDEFPGDWPKKTRYMSHTEMRDRPVLPTPEQVATSGKLSLEHILGKSRPAGTEKGIVLSFDQKKGEGRIKAEKGGEIILVNKVHLAPGLTMLEKGQVVIYRVGLTNTGRKRAEAVELMD